MSEDASRTDPEQGAPQALDLSLATLDELFAEIGRRSTAAVLLADMPNRKGFPEGCILQRFHGSDYHSNALLLEAMLYALPRRIAHLAEDEGG